MRRIEYTRIGTEREREAMCLERNLWEISEE